MYTHVYTYSARSEPASHSPARGPMTLGQMGSALMGSLRISWFLTEGFWGYSR